MQCHSDADAAVPGRDGVFKARNPRNETKDAEEVKETADTERDVPVDLQDAMTVEVKYHVDQRVYFTQ